MSRSVHGDPQGVDDATLVQQGVAQLPRTLARVNARGQHVQWLHTDVWLSMPS